MNTNIETQFDEMLDDLYGSIQVSGIEFYASNILKELDPIAYKVCLASFENNEKFNSILKGEDYDIDD